MTKDQPSDKPDNPFDTPDGMVKFAEAYQWLNEFFWQCRQSGYKCRDIRHFLIDVMISSYNSHRMCERADARKGEDDE